ncbi:hypothetical protein BH09BAC3_BH09BAC3_02850 [soil metagenome]
MVKIIIENLAQKELMLTEVNKTALFQLLANYIDWMHECGGKGRCTSCKMIVSKGMENLSSLTPAEKKYGLLGLLKNDERLACQVKVLGDITVRVPDDSRLGHMKYT